MGSEIAAIALGLVGTPFRARSSNPAHGLDCVGLVRVALEGCGVDCDQHAREAGMAAFSDYRLAGDEFAKLDGLASQVLEVVWSSGGDVPLLEAGDILAFRSRAMPNHCGIFIGTEEMVHASDAPLINRVVRQPLDKAWMGRLARVYRFGVAA